MPVRRPHSTSGGREGRTRWLRVLKYTLLTLMGLLFFVIPLWLALVTSAKPLGEAIDLSLGLPQDWAAADNYGRVFVDGRIARSFGHSLVVTSVSCVGLLLLGSMAAWAFARTGSRLLRVVYYAVIVGVLVPPALVPSLVLMRILGIEGTHAALILFTVSTKLPLVIFLMTGFVRAMPREYEDAAAVDGASTFQTYVRVVVPLMRPILLTVLVILVIIIWNEAFSPFFLLHGQERATLPLSLLGLTEGSRLQIAWNLLFAHLVLVSLPLIVVYLIVQRHIVGGLSEGAIRG
jgi:raffinose/stachyose/melibiose transport system permease protein